MCQKGSVDDREQNAIYTEFVLENLEKLIYVDFENLPKNANLKI